MSKTNITKWKTIAWKAYFYLWVAFISINVLLLIFMTLNSELRASAGSGEIISELARAGFTLIYLVGLYGFISQKAFGRWRTWRALFYLMCFGLVSLVILVLTLQDINAVIGFCLNMIFTAPMMFALYRYSDKSFPVWENTTLFGKTSHLAALLNNDQPIIATVETTTDSMLETTTVIITKAQKEFTVELQKVTREDESKFFNTFDNLEQVVKFLENNTSLRVGDFSLSNPKGKSI